MVSEKKDIVTVLKSVPKQMPLELQFNVKPLAFIKKIFHKCLY